MGEETGPGSDMENEEAKGQDRVSSGQGNTHPYVYMSVHGHAHTHEHSHWDHRLGGWGSKRTRAQKVGPRLGL